MKPSRSSNVVRPRDERGFALLIVFLMAAAVALMMYQQIPRVAFESQRDKEELLIDRGKQYSRAITLYYHEFNKFPSRIEDLENTNNKRFLRHRYIDPMTGKNEWRLIHANATGALTDSLVVKPPAPPGSQLSGNNSGPGTGGSNNSGPNGGTNTFGSSSFGTTGTSANTAANQPNPNDPNAPPPQVNAAVQRRPSDRTFTSSNGPLTGSSNATVDPNDPRYWPPITLTPVTQPGQTAPGQPGQPGQGQPGFNQQFPGQQLPGQQFPGQTNTGQLNPGSPKPTGQLNAGQTLQGNFGGQQFPGQLIGQQLINQQQQVAGQPFQSQPLPGQYDPNQQVNQPPLQVAPTGPPVLPGQPGFDPRSGGYGPDGTWIPNQPVAPQPGFNQPGFNQPGMNQAGMGQAGQAPGGAGNAAIPMINNMLRNPAPTPPATPTPTDSTAAMNATALVGVASKFEAPSIKIYKTRQKYNEWEFVFEVRSNAPTSQAPNDPLNQNQSGSGSTNSNTPGSSSPGSSPFGTGQPNSSPTPFGTGQPNSSPTPFGQGQPNSIFNPG